MSSTGLPSRFQNQSELHRSTGLFDLAVERLGSLLVPHEEVQAGDIYVIFGPTATEKHIKGKDQMVLARPLDDFDGVDHYVLMDRVFGFPTLAEALTFVELTRLWRTREEITNYVDRLMTAFKTNQDGEWGANQTIVGFDRCFATSIVRFPAEVKTAIAEGLIWRDPDVRARVYDLQKAGQQKIRATLSDESVHYVAPYSLEPRPVVKDGTMPGNEPEPVPEAAAD